MKTFDEIYILDLHGNSKKKERSPDGTTDQNVFDIMQGVSIGIFVKKQCEAKVPAKVFHQHLYGVREIWTENVNNEKELTGGKYQWLARNDISSTEWKEIEPNKPFYLFTPQDETLREEYQSCWKITEMMPTNVLGFQTHRDFFAIDFDKNVLLKRINDLRETNKSDDEIRRLYGVTDSSSWTVSKARKKLRENKNWQSDLIKCAYRPFDNRFSYFSSVAMDRPRRELIDHVFKKDNLCLLSSRQQATVGYQHCFVAKEPANDCVVSTTSREANQVFPLYLYPTERETMLGVVDRLPNFSDEFINDFKAKLKLEFVSDGKGDLVKTFAPEDIFNYAYAVFHSPTYRSRYTEFLKIDFPRLPLTSNLTLLRLLVNLGSELVGLHLLEADIETGVTFPEKGSNEVETVKYENEKVWINKTQYFENIPETVWNFHIGGYQVLQKWLKDRKGRTLSFDDLEHYQTVVSALLQTIELMSAIDEAIEENGGFPIE